MRCYPKLRIKMKYTVVCCWCAVFYYHYYFFSLFPHSKQEIPSLPRHSAEILSFENRFSCFLVRAVGFRGYLSFAIFTFCAIIWVVLLSVYVYCFLFIFFFFGLVLSWISYFISIQNLHENQHKSNPPQNAKIKKLNNMKRNTTHTDMLYQI